MKPRFAIAIIIALATLQPSAAHASQNIQESKDILSTINEFADKFCLSAPITSSGKSLNASGKAELSTLLSKIFGADIGTKFELVHNKNTGVLQRDLAGVITNSNNCRMAIWPTLGRFIETASVIGVVPDPRRQMLGDALELERNAVVRRIIGGLKYMGELSVSSYLSGTIPNIVGGVTCNEIQIMIQYASQLSRSGIVVNVASYIRRPFPEDCFEGIARLVSRLSVRTTLEALQNSQRRY